MVPFFAKIVQSMGFFLMKKKHQGAFNFKQSAFPLDSLLTKDNFFHIGAPIWIKKYLKYII